MTSISKNEMIEHSNIPLCNVWYLNGILKISLEIFPKKMYSLHRKIQKYLGNNKFIVSFKILDVVM